MSNKILVLGASFYYVNVINSIKELGYEVFVLDKNPDSYGFKYADKFKVIDICDKEGVYNFSKENKIDGIMVINDFGVRSAFYTSQKLGLINPSYLTGICGNDKGLLRDVWAHEKLPQPKYFVFSASDKIKSIEARISYPMVIKPTDAGGGSRGVSIAGNKKELAAAIRYAQPFVKNDRFIAEEFIDGVEVSVEAMVYKGTVYTLLIGDRHKPETGQDIVATSIDYPTSFNKDIVSKIQNTVVVASEALGVSHGATHTELIINKGVPKLVDMGIRGGGGHIFSTIIHETTGVNAPQELAKILCGEAPDLSMKKETAAVYRFFSSHNNGKIASIIYDEDLVRSDFVVDFGLTAKVGDTFNGLTDGTKRLGYAVIRGENLKDAVKHADVIENSIKFNII